MNRTRRGLRRGTRAFTLVELLVVVSIIALLISILLPSLKKAREQAKSVVCLSNIKSMATGVLTYASEYGGTLPGPLHPAIYRNQTLQNYADRGMGDASARHSRNRQLTWVLHQAMSQRGESKDGNVADSVGTCPTMASVMPDSHFDSFETQNGYYVYPTHYVLNHYGTLTSDPSPGGLNGKARITDPPYYFGLSPYLGAPQTLVNAAAKNGPKPISRISAPSDEWMLADAWYRGVTSPYAFAQQEGPYQSEWSGIALPYYAPHFKKGKKSVPVDKAERSSAASGVRKNKGDGRTNTGFFDGHGAPVTSKSLTIILKSSNTPQPTSVYGFPGTVNWDLGGNFNALLSYVWE